MQKCARGTVPGRAQVSLPSDPPVETDRIR
jgi:hypothetical protein